MPTPRRTPPRRFALFGLVALLGLLVAAGLARRGEAERVGVLGGLATPAAARPLGAQALVGRYGDLDGKPVDFEAAVVGVSLAPDGFRYALDRAPRDHPGLFLAGADRPDLFRVRLWVTVDGLWARDRPVLVGYDGDTTGMVRGAGVRVRGTTLGRHADSGTPLVRAEAIEVTRYRPLWCAWRVVPGGECGEGERRGPR